MSDLPARLPTGSVGLHREIAQAVALLRAHGVSIDFAEAMGLTAAAFRHYFFTAADNHAWETVAPSERWRWDSLDVENYGAMHALSSQTGIDLRVYDRLALPAQWALVIHELGGGRAVVLRDGALGISEPAVAVGFVDEPGRRVLRVRAAGAEEIEEIQVSFAPKADGGESDADATEALRQPRPGSFLTARPGEQPPPSRCRALRVDALRWTLQHAASKREIIHRKDAFYAAGSRAWAVAAQTLLEDDASAYHLSDPGDDVASAPAGADPHRFWWSYLSELERARRAAAVYLDRWALDLWSATADVPNLPGGSGALTAAAEAARAVALRVAEARAKLPLVAPGKLLDGVEELDATCRAATAKLLLEAGAADDAFVARIRQVFEGG